VAGVARRLYCRPFAMSPCASGPHRSNYGSGPARGAGCPRGRCRATTHLARACRASWCQAVAGSDGRFLDVGEVARCLYCGDTRHAERERLLGLTPVRRTVHYTRVLAPLSAFSAAGLTVLRLGIRCATALRPRSGRAFFGFYKPTNTSLRRSTVARHSSRGHSSSHHLEISARSRHCLAKTDGSDPRLASHKGAGPGTCLLFNRRLACQREPANAAREGGRE